MYQVIVGYVSALYFYQIRKWSLLVIEVGIILRPNDIYR